MTIFSPPGSIQIDKMLLTNYDKSKSLDLSLICYEFNIYESINKAFVTASFLIRDGTSLLTQFPIIGQETIDLSFKTPNDAFKKSITMQFRVIAVNDPERRKAREIYYVLSCVTPGAIKDMNTRIRKSYSNMTISDMAKNVWSDFIGEQLIYSDPTEGQRTIVLPNFSPSRAMKFLCREAKSQNYESSNYMFYQNCDGFFFQTTDNMINPVASTSYKDLQGISIDKYYGNEFDYMKTPKNSRPIIDQAPTSTSSTSDNSPSGKPWEFLKLNSFQFQNIGSYMKLGSMGALENTFRFYDPITSFYQEKKYNYLTDNKVFQKTSMLQSSPYLTSTNDYTKDGESFVGFEPTNVKQVNDYGNDQKFDMLHYKHGSKTIFENLIAQIIIPGDSEKRVGDVIWLELPEYGATDDVEGEVNKFISGEYLILSVRQMYTTKSYNTIMTVAKNAYEKEIGSK